jgi:hypothetical protein
MTNVHVITHIKEKTHHITLKNQAEKSILNVVDEEAARVTKSGSFKNVCS